MWSATYLGSSPVEAQVGPAGTWVGRSALAHPVAEPGTGQSSESGLLRSRSLPVGTGASTARGSTPAAPWLPPRTGP